MSHWFEYKSQSGDWLPVGLAAHGTIQNLKEAANYLLNASPGSSASGWRISPSAVMLGGKSSTPDHWIEIYGNDGWTPVYGTGVTSLKEAEDYISMLGGGDSLSINPEKLPEGYVSPSGKQGPQTGYSISSEVVAEPPDKCLVQRYLYGKWGSIQSGCLTLEEAHDYVAMADDPNVRVNPDKASTDLTEHLTALNIGVMTEGLTDSMAKGILAAMMGLPDNLGVAHTSTLSALLNVVKYHGKQQDLYRHGKAKLMSKKMGVYYKGELKDRILTYLKGWIEATDTSAKPPPPTHVIAYQATVPSEEAHGGDSDDYDSEDDDDDVFDDYIDDVFDDDETTPGDETPEEEFFPSDPTPGLGDPMSVSSLAHVLLTKGHMK